MPGVVKPRVLALFAVPRIGVDTEDNRLSLPPPPPPQG